MKVLITGATGLVGSHIVELCQQDGIEVHYLTTSKNKLTSDTNYKGFYWNPATGEIDEKCLEGVNKIIHLAGANIAQKWTDQAKKEILSSRVESTMMLLKLLKKHPNHSIEQVISASAIGVYPSSLTALHEESETAIGDSFAALVVQEWEQAVDQFEQLNIPVAKVRIGIVLATDGGALPKVIGPIKKYVGAPLGSGEQWQSWIHIRDLAKLFLFVAKHNFQGVFNGVAPNPVTQAKLTKEAAAVLNKPLWLPKVPAFVLKLALGEMSRIVLDSHRVSSKKVEEKGFHFEFVNVQAALQDLLG